MLHRFGPVYARKQYEGEQTDYINESRYKVLKDQLEIYDEARISWSIWLYKDIGFQGLSLMFHFRVCLYFSHACVYLGMTHVNLQTPYMKLFENFLAKKYRLAVDAWGSNDALVDHVADPYVEWMKSNVPNPEHQKMYPNLWGFKDRIARINRNILMAEYMVMEWAEHFVGKSESELDELAGSFKLENCDKREGLNKVLQEHHSVASSSK